MLVVALVRRATNLVFGRCSVLSLGQLTVSVLVLPVAFYASTTQHITFPTLPKVALPCPMFLLKVPLLLASLIRLVLVRSGAYFRGALSCGY